MSRRDGVPRSDPRSALRFGPLLLVGGLLAAAVVAAALSSPRVTNVPVPEIVISQGPTRPAMLPEQGPTEAAGDGLPDWVAQLALAIGLLVVLAVVLLALWLVIREALARRKGVSVRRLAPERRAANEPPQSAAEEVVAALDEGIADLSNLDDDPRRAVIACWVRLEQAAAQAGTPRHVGDTPTDLVLRLLGAHRVDPAVLDRFAGLYREARYATHVIDGQMRAAAQAALRQLRGELTAEAAAEAEAVAGGGPVNGAGAAS